MVETLRSVLRFRRFELDPAARRLARAASVIAVVPSPTC
jgi:hypothetical protein